MTDSERMIARWKEASHFRRKVSKILIRAPRVQGHLQLFGFMVSEDQLIKLAHTAFTSKYVAAPRTTRPRNDALQCLFVRPGLP